MGFPILVRHLYIESGPRYESFSKTSQHGKGEHCSDVIMTSLQCDALWEQYQPIVHKKKKRCEIKLLRVTTDNWDNLQLQITSMQKYDYINIKTVLHCTYDMYLKNSTCWGHNLDSLWRHNRNSMWELFYESLTLGLQPQNLKIVKWKLKSPRQFQAHKTALIHIYQ